METNSIEIYRYKHRMAKEMGKDIRTIEKGTKYIRFEGRNKMGRMETVGFLPEAVIKEFLDSNNIEYGGEER